MLVFGERCEFMDNKTYFEKRHITRNKAILCIVSRARMYGYDMEKDYCENELAIGDFLKQVCEEQHTYDEMKAYYMSAIEGDENDLFVQTKRFNDSFSFRVANDGFIYIYYYQNPHKTENIVPWDYPHTITKLSKPNGCDCDTFEKDCKEMSTLQMICKYVIGIEYETRQPIKKSSMYWYSDDFSIEINQHITMCYTTSGGEREKQYIADAWYFSDEEILRDLETMNFLQFGKEYKSFWAP